MPSDNSGQAIQPTGAQVISETEFYVIAWVFVAICTIAFAVRAYIRYVCFRRLVVEDWLMLVALIMHNADAIVAQLYVRYCFVMETAERGDYSVVTPDFFTNSKKGLAGFGASVFLAILGVLIVKINFLLFFRRLGRDIRVFNIMWWVVLVFTVAGSLAQIGMEDYKCVFGPASFIFGPGCTSDGALKRNYFNAIFSCAVDAASDAMIIVFPTVILWKSGINLQKKIVLTFVFGLVAITIAITVARGSVFNEIYTSMGTAQAKEQEVSWTWFWFYCEFSVAYIIACIVSFRTLFVQRKNESSARYQQRVRREQAYRSALRRGWRAKAREFHDSVLDTCKTLEGEWSDSFDEMLAMDAVLPKPASGLMTVDFGNDDNWSTRKTTDDVKHSVSMQSLDPAYTRRVAC
ncbi:hypothetical protein QBC46DRAFT_351976 [Diplogelasinospora grovesii]|uniref:Rhodopsin domain-containing protein n=1 Tax=Diplogelasinospora grovesii TaxID=303347 RepID=A0AAN6NCW3_9PEZI|nr:hypothetical protein QBC46DRAFT_351976 [Diplogelasinospora grovesii]